MKNLDWTMTPQVKILCGIAIILVGIIFGQSVFLGTAYPIDWLFDSLAVFYIVRGSWDLLKKT